MVSGYTGFAYVLMFFPVIVAALAMFWPLERRRRKRWIYHWWP
jgi:hypothetical protein